MLGGTGTLALGGASLGNFSLNVHKTLSNPKIKHVGEKTDLVYTTGGEQLTVFSIEPNTVRVPVSAHKSHIRVRFSISHEHHTKMTKLKMKMRAPPEGSQFEEISLINHPNYGPNQPIHFYTDHNYSVFEIDDLGELGGGTVSFGFELLYVHDSTNKMYVDTEYNLNKGEILGTSYTVKGQTIASLPTRKAQ